MAEVHRARLLEQDQVPDSVIELSSMIRNYSADVFVSQHMHSAAEAAVAVSTSATPRHSTDQTCSQHSHAMIGYRRNLEGLNKACLNVLHIHGIRHSLGQVMASLSAMRWPMSEFSQVTGTVGGNTGKWNEQAAQSAKGTSGNVACTQDAFVKNTAVQDAALGATPEGLVRDHSHNELNWQEVCFKMCFWC
jgi:hypothetical protein